MEPAKQVGAGPALVRREVTRVITPGTLLDPSLLTATKSNYLAAVVVAAQRIGIAHADISTGAFGCVEIDGRDAREIARSELASAIVVSWMNDAITEHGAVIGPVV